MKTNRPGQMRGTNPTAILSEDDVRRIRRLYAEGYTQARLCQMFAVSLQTIGRVVRRENWGWVEDGAEPQTPATPEEQAAAAASLARLQSRLANPATDPAVNPFARPGAGTGAGLERLAKELDRAEAPARRADEKLAELLDPEPVKPNTGTLARPDEDTGGDK